jgi:hypothetical protein
MADGIDLLVHGGNPACATYGRVSSIASAKVIGGCWTHGSTSIAGVVNS